MPKIKCPYTYPAKSREAKINYICGIGGYSSRDGKFPIEFTVGTYLADLDFDTLYKRVIEDHLSKSFDPETRQEDALYLACLRQAYAENKEYLYDWALEDAARGLSDGDTYRMLWDGTMLDVKLELHGRGGKHLCIAEFEGITLRGLSSEELEYALSTQTLANGYETVEGEHTLRRGAEWSYSTDLITKLYKYVAQCAVDFTTEKASKEVEYQAGFHLQSRAEDLFEEAKALAKDKAALLADARVVSLQLPLHADVLASFANLCKACGLFASDITEEQSADIQ